MSNMKSSENRTTPLLLATSINKIWFGLQISEFGSKRGDVEVRNRAIFALNGSWERLPERHKQNGRATTKIKAH